MRRILMVLVAAMLLVVPALAQHSATLTWIQSSGCVGGTNCGPVTGNNVYRSTVSGVYGPPIFTSSTPITTYVDTSVTALGTYFYVVTATCTSCSPSESGKSSEVKAVIPGDAQPTAPGAPTVTVK